MTFKVTKNKSLEFWIRDTACSIRGAKDARKFRGFILPLIFAKWLCDVFDDEINRMEEEVGLSVNAFQLAKADWYKARKGKKAIAMVRFYLALVPNDAEQPVWFVARNLSELKKALMQKLFTEGLRNEPQK